jgi:thioredoxin-dependent peroxiredoxin
MRTLVFIAFLTLAACGSSQADPHAPVASVGQPAPAFMLQDQSGRVRQLSEYRGQKVVLYFYPRDATPGCTREACAFRDAWTRLGQAGAVVLGVSTDDVVSHARFHDEHQLPFDLLADVDGRVAASYDVPVRLGLSSRMTFLIDAQGVLRRVYRDVDPAVHADEVIAALESL